MLVAFYGDDFSGTSATAEALWETDTPTLIFTDPPSPGQLAERFPWVRAAGVAGTARTLPVDRMESTLIPIFETMKAYGAPFFLYKACSTFDSSPTIGSIGRAIEIGRRVFSPEFVPVLPAAPKLGRYTVFGHHFAALGQGEVFRLDRHPSMARHPITPMDESDLRLHLARQTELRSGLIDLFALDKGSDYVNARIDEFVAASIPIIVFDCLYKRHLDLTCGLLWQRATRGESLFMVGSQEVGYGLGEAWRKAGLLPDNGMAAGGFELEDKGPILVVSGSCATVNGAQIRWALQNGFAGVSLEAWRLLDPAGRSSELERVTEDCLAALRQGRSVVIHTAVGAADPRIREMRGRADELSVSGGVADEILGASLGELALGVVRDFGLRRLVIAGGDTAGRIQRHLHIQALEVVRAVGIAAPLCYVYSDNPRVNGLEMAFKGGQIGSIDYFGQARLVRTARRKATGAG